MLMRRQKISLLVKMANVCFCHDWLVGIDHFHSQVGYGTEVATGYGFAEGLDSRASERFFPEGDIVCIVLMGDYVVCSGYFRLFV